MPGATSAAGGQRAKKRCSGSGRLFASWTKFDGEAMGRYEDPGPGIDLDREREETVEKTRAADLALN